jgi:hypothetical protein
MTETPTPGQIAHAAWNEAHGNPGGWPSWDQLSPLVREKWEYTANAVYWKGYDEGAAVG